MAWWTVNAIDWSGKSYPLYFECETIEQAEHIINQLQLVTDEAGVCLMCEPVTDRRMQ